MNYYRRYMADYGAKTAALSLAEHGAYNLLLDICYSTEKPLPASYEALNRLCRAMSRIEQDAVKSVADAFFPVGEDGLRHNQRVEKELHIAQPAIEASRTNGGRGGRPRKNPVGFPNETQDITQTEPGGGQPPSPNHQPPSVNRQPSSANRQGKATAGRGSRLPADWQPSPDDSEFCWQERPDLDLRATANRFRDYWIAQPGSKGVKLDWSATWRNWVRNERRTNGSAGMTLGEKNRAAAEEATRRYEEEHASR